MQTIAIEGCDLVTWSKGSGLPLIVIAGGPGLASDYLAPLEALASDFKIVFFDQPGCGASHSLVPPTARQAVDATIAVIRELGGDRFAIAAHSWGAYLAAAASFELPVAPVSTVLFNPVPFDRAGFDAVGGKLVERVEPETLTRIGTLSSEGTAAAGAELMRIAMPAYSGRSDRLPEVNVAYNIATADGVTASLGKYDVRAAAEKMGKLTLVFGTTDYITTEEFNGVAPGAERIVIEGGHFSMFDSPVDLMRAIREGVGS